MGPACQGRGACFAGCCASGSAGRTGPRDAGQAGKRAGPGERPGALGLAGLGRAWGLLGRAGKRELGRAGWAAAVEVWAGFQAGLGFSSFGFSLPFYF